MKRVHVAAIVQKHNPERKISHLPAFDKCDASKNKSMNFQSPFDSFKGAFLELKSKLTPIFPSDTVHIVIGDDYTLPRTPVYIVMELFVTERENEDDYGIVLSVTYQHYDSTAVELSGYERGKYKEQ